MEYICDNGKLSGFTHQHARYWSAHNDLVVWMAKIPCVVPQLADIEKHLHFCSMQFLRVRYSS